MKYIAILRWKNQILSLNGLSISRIGSFDEGST